MIRAKQLFWMFIFLSVGYILFLVSNILFPFITAFIIAYFLHPLVSKLEKLKFSRLLATIIVSCAFFLILIFVSIKIMPLIYAQIGDFIKALPRYKLYINNNILPPLAHFLETLDPSLVVKIENSIQDILSFAFRYLGDSLSNIWKSGLALVNILSLIFLTPMVTFYVLRDWNVIFKKIDSWLPQQNKKNIKQQLSKIDDVLSGFIRGQFNVCLILAIFYSFALYLVGLDFALVVGVITGLLVFVPYIGFLLGASAGLIIAFLQYGDLKHIIIVFIIFVIGQILEGSFITPKIVGEKIGLHPVWLFFIVLSGGSLFGFVGVLFAVPIGATIGVIIRSLMQFYLSSTYYK